MGADASYAPNDVGPVPEDLLFIVPSKDRFLLITKTFLEVRDRSGPIETRVVSLEPSCACATETGTFVIGFVNGTVSEFDGELRLIHTFCLPGACHAHEGAVVGVATAYISELLVFTTGADKLWNVWTATQGLVSSVTFTAPPVAACASATHAWAADKFNRMHVLDLSDMSSSVFALPGAVARMWPLPGSQSGVVAVMEDGAVDIFSHNDVIAQFPPCGARHVAVLSTNAYDGTVTYIAGNDDSVSLFVLEHSLGEIARDVTEIAVAGDELVLARGARIELMRIANVMKRVKNLPDLELPRKTIAEFLSQSA